MLLIHNLRTLRQLAKVDNMPLTATFKRHSSHLFSPRQLQTDEVLAQQIAEQQAASALQVLYQRYARLVYRQSFDILRTREDAEDITQEIFLTLWQRCTYDRNRGSFKRFLLMNARSRSIDKLRAKSSRYRRLQALRDRTLQPNTNPPLEKATQQSTATTLRHALNTLPSKEKTVLESAYYHGLTQAEIARQYDLPLGTVKSRSRQGLQKLRTAITQH